MSLLLEALRRAEKQSLGDRANAAPAAHEAGLAYGAAPARPLTDGSTEGLRSEAGNDAARVPLELEPALRHESPAVPVACDEARPGASPVRGLASAQSQGANRPSPFHLVLGLLSAVAISAIGYFWHQLQRPPQSAQPGTVQPSPGGMAVLAQPAPAPQVIPGLPVDTTTRTTEIAAATSRATPPVAKRAATLSEEESAGHAAQPRPEVVMPEPREAARIHPQVEQGYAALRIGDFATARAAYQQVLREEPDNADAILGMAALDTNAGRNDLAKAYYIARLEASPHDAYAQAGLLALRGEQADPLRAESALRTLLAADPDAIPLNLSLGNQLARQGRWAEARQAYARALAGDPDHPDIVFNLAVSLDQLHRRTEATTQYRRALALAEHRFAAFSTEAARRRLAQLAR